MTRGEHTPGIEDRLRAVNVHLLGDVEISRELRNPDGPEAAELIAEMRTALEPFANVARRIRETQPTSEAWLEKVLFYMGTDDDPTKWSLTGRAFDSALAVLNTRHEPKARGGAE